MRTTAIFAALVLLVAPLAIPVAGASHWTLYRAGIDPSPGVTSEDDEVAVHEPGNYFDGRVNRVVLPATTPGDGGLFLDARIGQQAGYGAAHGIDFYAAHFTAPLHDRPDLVFPGIVRISAWFGWWNDINKNGILEDIHDRESHHEDEFLWKGVATNDSVGVNLFIIPSNRTTTNPGNPAWISSQPLEDHTHHSNADQGWVTNSRLHVNGMGLLNSFHTLVLANAPFSPGHPAGWDIDDEMALYDVDRYEAVSSDVEAMYRATTATYSTLRETLFGNEYGYVWDDVVLPVYRAANEAVNDTQRNPEIASLVRFTLTTAFSAAAAPFDVIHAPSPLHAKEPNHPEDDWEGRAFYGGVGDHGGSGNVYPAYLQGYHYSFDSIARTRACAGAFVQAPGGPQLPAPNVCQGVDSEPMGAILNNGERSTGFVLTFSSNHNLWHDKNGDAHIGKVCNPDDPEEFDAAANRCRRVPKPYPHDAPSASGNNEVIGVCGIASARGDGIVLTPLDGGTWDSAVVVRDARESTRGALDRSHEIRDDREAIVLRWDERCATSYVLSSRDDVVFPMAPTFRIHVETYSEIEGYVDHSTGITLGREGVRDVDVLHPWM